MHPSSNPDLCSHQPVALSAALDRKRRRQRPSLPSPSHPGPAPAAAAAAIMDAMHSSRRRQPARQAKLHHRLRSQRPSPHAAVRGPAHGVVCGFPAPHGRRVGARGGLLHRRTCNGLPARGRGRVEIFTRRSDAWAGDGRRSIDEQRAVSGYDQPARESEVGIQLCFRVARELTSNPYRSRGKGGGFNFR